MQNETFEFLLLLFLFSNMSAFVGLVSDGTRMVCFCTFKINIVFCEPKAKKSLRFKIFRINCGNTHNHIQNDQW